MGSSTAWPADTPLAAISRLQSVLGPGNGLLLVVYLAGRWQRKTRRAPQRSKRLERLAPRGRRYAQDGRRAGTFSACRFNSARSAELTAKIAVAPIFSQPSSGCKSVCRRAIRSCTHLTPFPLVSVRLSPAIRLEGPNVRPNSGLLGSASR